MSGILRTYAQKLKSRELSSVELTKAYIAAIERENAKYNIYVHTCFDQALKQAEEADKRLLKGGSGMLCGIPFALKDNICTDGILTTCCSKILQGFVPYYDATVWQKLQHEGAVLLGKTNMDEFAMGSTNETSCYGAPSNPRNTAHVTGGSSGGSAAAVCANLAAYALGSDTGGSIRQPAAYCGVVGLKPTYGAVSRYGLIAYGSSLDQIGPVAQSVGDCALVFDAIKGYDKNDGTSCKVDETPTNLTGDIKGLKIGVVKQFFEGLSGETKKCVDDALSWYRSAGATLIEMDMPSLSLALPVYYIVACAEASSNLGRYDGIRYGYRASGYTSLDDMVVKTRTEGFGDEVKRRILLGTYVLSSGYYDAYYKKACLLRERIRADFYQAFEKCDVMLAPVAPTTAPLSGQKLNSPVDMYLSDVCTVPVNIAGLPAVSLPCGKDKEGLPVGMQLIGNHFAEKTIQNAAYAFEQSHEILEQVQGGVRL
jgi:aspartyl-tRNA(Asn)/glutamyl-tRNA(Gln) amidotransferase subunit A